MISSFTASLPSQLNAILVSRTSMKALGYWRVRKLTWSDSLPGFLDDGWTDEWQADPTQVLAALGARPADDRIVAYLRSGHVVETWRGWSWCRFNCGVPDEEMGHSDLTDGVWVWPEGLSHYVESHGLALPDEFVQLAISSDGKVPSLPNGLPPHSRDPKFWNDWYAAVVGAG